MRRYVAWHDVSPRIRRRLMWQVLARDGWRCHLCGGSIRPGTPDHREELTLDHLVPVSKGGSHTLDNLAPAHHSCNSRRGSRSLKPLPVKCVNNIDAFTS